MCIDYERDLNGWLVKETDSAWNQLKKTFEESQNASTCSTRSSLAQFKALLNELDTRLNAQWKIEYKKLAK